MKKLKDLCLQCLGNNLHGSIRRIVPYLAPVHKELLLERLVYHDKLTPDYLPHVTYNLFSASLKHVNFYKCEQITDAVLLQLSVSGCQLTSLTIYDCRSVTDAGIVHITKGQTTLVTLKLQRMQTLTAKAFTAVNSPALTTADFRGCHFNTDAVRTLLKSNTTIQSLGLSYCKNLDDSVFPLLAEKLGESLEVLKLRNLHFLSNASLKKIASSCPNIVELYLDGCNRITEEGFSEITARCKRLKQLDLSYCTGLQKPSVLDSFTSLSSKTLTQLSLCGVMFENTDCLVSATKRLIGLKSVKFCGIPALTDDALDEILGCIGGGLESLDLSGGLMSPLTDAGLTAIDKHCPILTCLGLSMLKVTGEKIIPILTNQKRAAKLEVLMLSSKMLDVDVAYYASRNCTALRDLTLSGVAHIEDETLFALAKNCKQLTEIGLKGCRKVTDAGVCALAQYCTQLKVVVLSGIHNLTDRSVFSLANGCPYLDEIYLSGCNQITKAAIAYLVDFSIPRVFFEHRIPNALPDQIMARNLDTGLFCAPQAS